MKKALSLALALVMCLGLTVPVFAVEVGDTSVSLIDNSGTTYTLNLSNPITGVRTIDYGGEGGTTVYQIPVGTVVTPEAPAGSTPQEDGQDLIYVNGDHTYQYLVNMLDFDTAPGAEEKQWNWYPFQGESPIRETLPLYENNISEVECRHSWLAPSSYPGAAGVGSAKALIYFELVKDVSTDPEPTTPTDPDPATPAEPVVKTAIPTNDQLYVDGVLAVPAAYKIGGSNYFKIRDVAALLNGTDAQFSVGYDNATQSVTLTTGEGYEKRDSDLAGVPAGGEQTAVSTNDAIYINGEKAELTVYKIGGSNYFKLRDLGEALGFNVGWSQELGMFIESDKPYSAAD